MRLEDCLRHSLAEAGTPHVGGTGPGLPFMLFMGKLIEANLNLYPPASV